MITETRGDLLKADVDALVNTVNTVGVMGKGIALQFKRAYPDMFRAYEQAVKAGDVTIGRVHVWETAQLAGPRFVINFPTKQHWRGRSRLDAIRLGLKDLVRVVKERGTRSIAIPPLGCGQGGLRWEDVRPLLSVELAALTDVDVRIYPPAGAPHARDMAAAGSKPPLTRSRAALVSVLAHYAASAMDWPSLVEAQKLMYFLQAAGEPLNLDFVKNRYGPYADNLRHVLLRMEGHYLSGFGDGSAAVADAEHLAVLPGATAAADRLLAGESDTTDRINRVLSLAEGYESAYGMELLSTVHWAAHGADASSRQVVELVHAWSPRKSRMFTSDHIRIAWEALRDKGWLQAQRIPAGR